MKGLLFANKMQSREFSSPCATTNLMVTAYKNLKMSLAVKQFLPGSHLY